MGQCVLCVSGCIETGATRTKSRSGAFAMFAFSREKRPSGENAKAAIADCYLVLRIQTPHGKPPTGIVLIVLNVAVSMTLTLFERPFAT